MNWGGSICLETLVNTGTPAGYRQTYTAETLLLMITLNMTRARMQCTTAVGPYLRG